MRGANLKSIYLGDGVYVEFRGFDFRLYTDRGLNGVHEIFLEPAHIEHLKMFMDKCFKRSNYCVCGETSARNCPVHNGEAE